MRWAGIFVLAIGACSPADEASKTVVEPAAVAPTPALVEAFDGALITKLVAPMDYMPIGGAEETPEANAWVEFKGADGETFRAEARHCASHRPGVKCEGVTLTARVVVPGAKPAEMLDYANRFNSDQATVFMFQDGADLVVSDDIVLDGGIPEVNLDVQLAAFSTVLRQNREFLLRAAGAIE